MEKSMKRYMKVGTILHVSYKEVGSGEGPILECLKKIVTDPYFEAVEVAHMKDSVVRKKAAEMIAAGHMTTAYGGQGLMLGAGLNINDLNEEGRQKALASLKIGMRFWQAATRQRQWKNPSRHFLLPPESFASMRKQRETCRFSARCLIMISQRNL